MVRRFKSKKTKSQGKIAHIKTEIDGITFDSKTESNYYLKLKAEKEEGKVLSFRRQVTFILQEAFIVVDSKIILKSDKEFNSLKRKTKAPTVQAIKYIADYVVDYSDGTTKVIDVKGGITTTDFELKRKLLLFTHPGINFEVVTFYKGEWIDFYEYKKQYKIDKAERKRKKAEKESEAAKVKKTRATKKKTSKTSSKKGSDE